MVQDETSKIPEHIVQRLNLVSAFGAESAAARTGLIVEGIRTGYVLNASAIGLLALGAEVLRLDRSELAAHSIPFFIGLVATTLTHFCAYFGQSRTTEFYAAIVIEQLDAIIGVEGVGTARSGRHHKTSTLMAKFGVASMVAAFLAFAGGGLWLLLSAVPVVP